MDGREAEHILFRLSLLVRGLAVEQGDLGDEVADILELRGEADEALEVLFAFFPVGEDRLEEGAIPSLDADAHGLGGGPGDLDGVRVGSRDEEIGRGRDRTRLGLGGLEAFEHVLERDGQVIEVVLGRFGHALEHRVGAERADQAAALDFVGLAGGLADLLGGDRADLRQQAEQARQRDLVERVVHEAQVREDVLHVREVEELMAAGDDERHAHGVEFHLQFKRLVVRAVEHVHVLERVAFMVQLHELADHELRLLGSVADGEDGGLRAALAHGLEATVEAFDARTVAEDLVGEGQDLRGRTVVGVDRVDQRARVALGEGDDVLPVGAAPGVDALGVVADGHDLVLAGEQVDDAALQAVGILELVHQDVLEALAVVGERGRVVLEHVQPQAQQVIEVAQVALLLRRGVGRAELHQLLRATFHPVEAFGEDVLQGAERIAGVRIGVEDDGRLGVRLVLDEGAVDRLHDLGEKLLRFLLVEDGEVRRARSHGRVAAQDALADGVEGAAPELAARDAREVLDALEHLLGRLVGERQQ